MFLDGVTERRTFTPLYLLPRDSRRRLKRLERIIEVRRGIKAPRIPVILWLCGWKAARPLHEERFKKWYFSTRRYSVRGTVLCFPIWKLHKWAVDEVIAPR